MPYTFNGIGTWYWGRGNVQRSEGVCEFCRRAGELLAFDTTLFAVVVFIPVIPLGRKRVMKYCQRCRKHRVMKLGEWEVMRDNNFLETEAAWRNDRANAKAIGRLVGTLTYHGKLDKLRELAPEILRAIPADAETIAFLGDSFLKLGDLKEAERLFQVSLGIADQPRTRERLGELLLLQRKPDEADRQLRHLLRNPINQAWPLLAMLIEGFQATGRHDRALDLLDECSGAFPDLTKDSGWRKLKKISTRHRRSGRPYVSKSISTRAAMKPRESGWSRWTPRLVFPALALLAFIAYVASAAWIGLHHKMYLVNGLQRPYEAVIDGKSYQVPAQSPLVVEVQEGTFAVEVRGAQLDEPKQTVTFETPFWSRPLSSEVFVLNPERTAILATEETEYARQPREIDPHYTVYVGENAYRLNGLDYVFKPFPATIDLKRRERIRKRRLELVRTASGGDAALEYGSLMGETRKQEYLRRRAQAEPTAERTVWQWATGMEPTTAAQELRKRLSERPVLVDWHRTYQTIAWRVRPEPDLLGEYRQYLAADPNNAALKYLLGRLTVDPATERELYNSALSDPVVAPYANAGLASLSLANARFDDALGFAIKAHDALPEHGATWQVREQALIAAGQADVLLRENAKTRKRYPRDLETVATGVRLLGALGRRDEALKLISEFDARFKGDKGDKGERTRNHSFLVSSLALGEGDETTFLQYAEAFSELEFDAVVLKGDLETASSMSEAQELTAIQNLVLFIAMNGQGVEAQAAFHQAIAGMNAGGPLARFEADQLSRESPPDDTFYEANDDPADKRVILAAAGIRFPGARDRCFELARKLNYDRTGPWMLLRKVLGT